jgi:hypothetical protein
MVGAVVILGVLALGAYSVLVPPTSGAGWRLDPDARWVQPASPGGLVPTVVIYTATESTVGLGITVYGSSSCPPRVRSVRVDGGTITIRASRDVSWIMTGCTADAAPHPFGILVDRDRISLPITVVVHPDELPTGTATFDELP